MTKDELYELSRDREQQSGEVLDWNDFYGHAISVKRFAGLPEDYQLKFVLEHGAGLAGRKINPRERDAVLPAMVTMSSGRFPVLRELTGKALFTIGAYIRYADQAYDEDTLARERKRLGRSLLVFPFHSTHRVNADYDIAELCSFIERLSRDFDTIRVCMFWKDVLRGNAEPFLERGFECVTAGHMFDPLFLARLKSLIELSTATLANSAGTSLAYSLVMNRPHFLYLHELRFSADKDEYLKHDLSAKDWDWDKKQMYREMVAAFAVEPGDEVSQAQHDFGERYCGTGEGRSPQELREIIDITEDMYARGSGFFMGAGKLMPRQAAEYLNNGRAGKAALLLDEARRVWPEMPGLTYGKALALARGNRLSEAVRELDGLLAAQPTHPKAAQLRDELRTAV